MTRVSTRFLSSAVATVFLALAVPARAQCPNCGDPNCTSEEVLIEGYHCPPVPHGSSTAQPRLIGPSLGTPVGPCRDPRYSPYYSQGLGVVLPQPNLAPSQQPMVPGTPNPLQGAPLLAPSQLQPTFRQPSAGNLDSSSPFMVGNLGNDAATSPDSFSQATPSLDSALAASANDFASARGQGTGGAAEFDPNVLGDALGGGGASVSIVDRRSFSRFVEGFNAGPGQVAFGVPGTPTIPDDAFSTGPGSDASGDGLVDTFDIAEPLFPSDLDTSPGANFVFDGGTATYTDSNTSTTVSGGTFGDGDFWFLQYSFSDTLLSEGTDRVIAGPGVASRRIRIAEGISPEIRDRVFMNYSFFNDAQGGLGDISRWVIGSEVSFFNNSVSLETRLPFAATLASTQNLAQAEDRDFEVGNVSFITKLLLLKNESLTWSGGLGVTLPLADDTRLRNGNQLLLEVKNDSVHLLPFTGLLLRASENLFLQGFAQLDIDTNGDRVRGDARGGSFLPELGRFDDATLLYLDVSASQRIYRNRNRRNRRGLSTAFATAELHYTSTLEDANVIQGNGVTYTSFAPNLDVLNATFGGQLLFGQNLLVAPAMSVPLRDGFDRQFDYEAILQVNYLF